MAIHIYNNHQLPELPVWDKNTYPYAMVIRALLDEDYYLVVCHRTKPYVKVHEGKTVIAFDASSHKMYGFACKEGELNWSSSGEFDASRFVQEGTSYLYYIWGKSIYVWANTDILDEYGVVYYPYTEPEVFCKKSYQIGISIGKAISWRK